MTRKRTIKIESLDSYCTGSDKLSIYLSNFDHGQEFAAAVCSSCKMNGTAKLDPADGGEPTAKRLRLEEAATAGKSQNEDDTDDLAGLVMDGEDFVTEAQQQENEAQRRRELRRQRLQRVREAEGGNPKPAKEEQTRESTTSDGRSTNETAKDLSTKGKTPLSDGDDDPKMMEDNDSEFDMFSSSVSPISDRKDTATSASRNTKRGHGQADWDDTEGYYKAVIGEIISLRSLSSPSADPITFRVSGVIGKGVFSTVLKCSTVSNSSSLELPPVVALKCIRHNETMVKAAMNELQTLQKLNGSPGIVPLLMPTGASPPEHRGHVILVFSFMDYNLRDVLQKFGKGVGISLQAVRSYFGQLLAAATHLKKHGIIHADLKPDNILVSSDFGVVQLADFGSAIHVASPEQSQITPYLVSRFYRAPEIILGLTPTHAVDLWSLAVTVAEIFLGDPVFRGKSNNDMIYVFMQHLGAFSNRVIRQHLVQCQRLAVPRQFEQEGASYVFRQQTVDPVSGVPVHKFLSLLPENNSCKFPMGTPLKQKLLKAKSANDSKKMVLEFADLLRHCLALDPARRIALKDALQHKFFQANPSTAKNTNNE